jgi:hypothetical protein
MSAVSGASDVERLNITTVGNIGIGTSSPANELHVFDNTTTATSLIIQNNNLITTSNIVQGTSTSNVTSSGFTFTQAATPSFTVEGPTNIGTFTSSIDKFMMFTNEGINNTFTVPANFNCDILMIGGGGGGGTGYANGGGAGACIVAINQTLPTGSCIVRVGAGGGSTANGQDSFITVEGNDRYRAKGGGYAVGSYKVNGINGGCGGGASIGSAGTNIGGYVGGQPVSTNVVVLSSGLTSNIGPCLSSTFAVMGNAGFYDTAGSYASGGGIGTAGAGGGNIGQGKSDITINGTTYNFRDYFANGGLGNGGILGKGGTYGSGSNGAANTGDGATGPSSTGGSGIVIIRYRTGTPTTTYTHTPTLTTTATSTLLGNSAIELVRGTQGDSNTDYKLGNYGGDFKVISSSLSTDTDRLNITSAGNVGIGTTSPQVKLHVAGEIYATGNITAYFSDERLKTKISNITESLEMIDKLNGFYYIPNDLARFNGITNTGQEVGLSAQEVQRVLPEVVKIAPFDSVRNTEGSIVSKSGENYLTMSYERLSPVFVEAIKELEKKNIELKQEVTFLKEKIKVMCDKKTSNLLT